MLQCWPRLCLRNGHLQDITTLSGFTIIITDCWPLNITPEKLILEIILGNAKRRFSSCLGTRRAVVLDLVDRKCFLESLRISIHREAALEVGDARWYNSRRGCHLNVLKWILILLHLLVDRDKSDTSRSSLVVTPKRSFPRDLR